MSDISTQQIANCPYEICAQEIDVSELRDGYMCDCPRCGGIIELDKTHVDRVTGNVTPVFRKTR